MPLPPAKPQGGGPPGPPCAPHRHAAGAPPAAGAAPPSTPPPPPTHPSLPQAPPKLRQSQHHWHGAPPRCPPAQPPRPSLLPLTSRAAVSGMLPSSPSWVEKPRRVPHCSVFHSLDLQRLSLALGLGLGASILRLLALRGALLLQVALRSSPLPPPPRLPPPHSLLGAASQPPLASSWPHSFCPTTTNITRTTSINASIKIKTTTTTTTRYDHHQQH